MLTFYVGFLVVAIFCQCQTSANNCIFAPNCPDYVTWSPGYVCNDGYFPIIKKKIINGIQLKTVCCSEVTSCPAQQFWCLSSLHSGDSSNDIGSSAALAPSCSFGCVTKWIKYDNNAMIDGVMFEQSESSFVGRVRIFDGYQAGRIDVQSNGIFYNYGGVGQFSNESIEFLARNENFTYEWMSSSNGSHVANAVTLNVPRSSSQYIGRVKFGDFTYIGAVLRIMGGIYYADQGGIEKFSNNYEVLTCRLPDVPTTIAPIPMCPIQWKSHTSSHASIPPSSTPSTLINSVIIDAQNGILIGDALNLYSWCNLTDLSNNEVPATLTLPGGIVNHIGRIFDGDKIIIGTVDISSGVLQYTDDYGRVRNILCYEVLVCVNLISSTTSGGGLNLTSTTSSGFSSTSSSVIDSTTTASGSTTKSSTSTPTTSYSSSTISNSISTTPSSNNSTSSTVSTSGSSTTISSQTTPSSTSKYSTSTTLSSTKSSDYSSSTTISGLFNLTTTKSSDGYSSTASSGSSTSSSTKPSDFSSSTTSSGGLSSTSTKSISTTTDSIRSESTTTKSNDGSSSTTSSSGGSYSSTKSTTLSGSSTTSSSSSTQTTKSSNGSTYSSTTITNDFNSSTTPISLSSTTKSSSISISTTPSSNGSTSSTLSGSSSTISDGSTSTTQFSNISSSISTTPSSGSTTKSLSSSISSTSTVSSGGSSSTTPSASSSTLSGSGSSSTTPFSTTKSSTLSNISTSTTLSSGSSSTKSSDGYSSTTSNGLISSQSTLTQSTPLSGSSTSTKSSESTMSTTPSGIFNSTTTKSSSSSTTDNIRSESTTTSRFSSTDSTTISMMTNGIDISTLPFTTQSTLSQSTTMTSTIPTTDPPKTCVITWKTYDGIEDLTNKAVTADITVPFDAYVGQSSVYGNLLPGRIQQINSSPNTYCFYFGIENCINSFQYLENKDNYVFNWVHSHNGDYVKNAVNVQAFFIGRTMANGSLYLGTVVPGYGMVYVEDDTSVWYYTNKSYEVLTCSANLIPDVVYDCVQQWRPYLNNSQPSIDGVSAEINNSTFVGRMTSINTDYTLGKIEIQSPNQGLLYYNYGEVQLNRQNSEYLINDPNNSYLWVSSSYGYPVENAISMQKSSAFWPMYIGRVQINSTLVLVGNVLPSKGMTYIDEDGNEEIYNHYQVLTCTSPIQPVQNDCECIEDEENDDFKRIEI